MYILHLALKSERRTTESGRTSCGRVVWWRWRWSSCEETSSRSGGGGGGGWLLARHVDDRSTSGGGASATRDPLARSVLVVGVLLQVKSTQALRLVDERPLLGVGQLAPASTQPLTDLGVVHVRSDGRDLLTLDLQHVYTTANK